MDHLHEVAQKHCEAENKEDEHSCSLNIPTESKESNLNNHASTTTKSQDELQSFSTNGCNSTTQSTQMKASPRIVDNNKSYFIREAYGRKYPNPSNQICKYFKAGYCKNSSCSFKHSNNFKSFNPENVSRFKRNGFETRMFTNRNFKDAKSVPLCKYFKNGLCRNGDQCKFYHQKNISLVNNSEKLPKKQCTLVQANNSQNEGNTELSTRTVMKTPQNIYDLNSLPGEELSVLRDNELKQLKKRFPNHTVKENMTTFEFQPTDPDWPFDVRSLQFEAIFPEKYPLEVCQIEVVRNLDNIPSILIQYLNNSISEWFKKRHEDLKSNGKVELMFRPFLKWLDKNLEDLFISGLKMVQRDMKAREAGIEFVPYETLFSNSESKEHGELSSSENDAAIPNVSLCEESKKKVLTSEPKEKKVLETSSRTGNQGTKILLSNLELTEGAAAMACSKISISLQCARCKTTSNLTSPAKKDCGKKCEKCSKDIAFNFQPSTLHPYSNVLGNVDLMNCKIIDVILVDCYFLIDCFNCSKQVSVNGINYSQNHKLWCLFCNQKMVVCIGGVRFQAAKESMITGIKYTPAKKIAKQKDPVVKEGEPLPQLGACKHYKQSYRWLRFPCCGKIYPCDVCHNEKELDHEMKFASRMLCGFCAKEQQYSRDKPCTACSSNLTKKSGAHWEGGKGCRNKIQMSREDKQKYSGVAKTTSRKARSVTPGKKK